MDYASAPRLDMSRLVKIHDPTGQSHIQADLTDSKLNDVRAFLLVLHCSTGPTNLGKAATLALSGHYFVPLIGFRVVT